MLLRSAQEEVRVLEAAIRDSAAPEHDLLCSQLNTASVLLNELKDKERSDWGDATENQLRLVGTLLLVTLGLANEFNVDSAEALKAILLDESP